MSKHTKGPWTVRGSDPSEGCDCFWIEKDGCDIATAVGYTSDVEHRANAELIAAAPELLEALVGIIESPRLYVNFDALQKARDVIAKVNRDG